MIVRNSMSYKRKYVSINESKNLITKCIRLNGFRLRLRGIIRNLMIKIISNFLPARSVFSLISIARIVALQDALSNNNKNL